MNEKPVCATSDLQTRLFDPARREVVPADLTGRDWLVEGLILARSVVSCFKVCKEIMIMIILISLTTYGASDSILSQLFQELTCGHNRDSPIALQN